MIEDLTWRYGRFDDGNLEIRTRLAKHIGSAETTRSSSDDDDITLGIGVKVFEVATSHSTGDLALADGIEGERVPFVSKSLDDLVLFVDDFVISLEGHTIVRLLRLKSGGHGGVLRVDG